MNKKVQCLNCGEVINPAKCRYCPNCTLKTSTARIDFSTVLEDFSNVFHFEKSVFLYTLWYMIVSPGGVMLGYLKGERRKYQSPMTYLFFSIFWYGLWVHYVLEPQHVYIGLLSNVPNWQIMYIMTGLSIIGFVFSGYPRFNFFETFVVFSFTYGTCFILTPVFILLQVPFVDSINLLPPIARFMVSDVPSTAFIFYCIANFVSATNISWWRFALTALVGYAYYLFFIFNLSHW